MLAKSSLELKALRLPSQGQGLRLALSGAPSGLGRRRTAGGEAGGINMVEKAPAGAGPVGGRGRDWGRGLGGGSPGPCSGGRQPGARSCSPGSCARSPCGRPARSWSAGSRRSSPPC